MDNEIVFELVLSSLSRASGYIGLPQIKPYKEGGKIVVQRLLEPHDIFGCEIQFSPEEFYGKVTPITRISPKNQGRSPLEFRKEDGELGIYILGERVEGKYASRGTSFFDRVLSSSRKGDHKELVEEVLKEYRNLYPYQPPTEVVFESRHPALR